MKIKGSLAYYLIGLIFLVALSATSISYYVSTFSLKKAIEKHEAVMAKKTENDIKAKIKEDGSLGTTQKSSLADLEKSLAKVEIPPKVFIKEPIFENLKGIFGKDVEILVNY